MSRSSALLDSMWHGTERKARTLVLSLLVLLVAFWPTLQSLHGVWNRITYSHGYLVAPVVLWLAWRRRDALLRPGEGAGAALAPLLLLSLVWFVAVVTDIQVIHQAVLPVMMLLWVAAIAGWRSARRIFPAVAIFLFAVPFWEILTRPLQLMTIAVSGAAVKAIGIQAEITGEFIHIASGTFRVANSCSGLRFFIIGLLLGTLYAHLFARRWSTRIQIMAASAGLALIANWIRVAGLVVIGEATEMQWEHLEDHGFYGWVIFVIVFTLFFPLAGYLADRGRKASKGRESGGPRREEASTADPASVRQRVWTATGLALLGPVVYFAFLAAPARAGTPSPDPERSAEWTRLAGPAQGPRGWAPDFPDPDLRSASLWTDGTTEIHRLYLFYRRQTQGTELVNAENRIAPADDLAGEGYSWLPEKNVWVREAFVRTPDGPVVVWYWYRVGGVKAVSPAKAKALQLWAFLRRRSSASLTTLSAACLSERCQVEREALRDFITADD